MVPSPPPPPSVVSPAITFSVSVPGATASHLTASQMTSGSFSSACHCAYPNSDTEVLPREDLQALRRSSTGNLHDDSGARPDIQGSPLLRRAGLLQPKPYNPLMPGSYNEPSSLRTLPVPHSQDTIRMNTVELSKMSFSPAPEDSNHTSNLIFPPADASSLPSSSSASVVNDDLSQSQITTASDDPSFSSSHVSVSPPSSSSSSSSFTTQKATSPPPPLPRITTSSSGGSTPHMPFRPSGLSLLRQEYGFGHSPASDGSQTPTPIGTTPTCPLPKVHWSDRPRPARAAGSTASMSTTATITPGPHFSPPQSPTRTVTETTPLLNGSAPHPRSPPRYVPVSGLLPLPPPHPPRPPQTPHDTRKWFHSKVHTLLPDHALEKARNAATHAVRTAVRSIPAVLLGSLLNILDGVSYGMIIFPGTGVFADLGPMGVSMFFLSTVIAQAVYTLGGSGFAGANGSMMIEVVPFFHVMATSIAGQIGEDKPKEIIATTIAAYALSSILTGSSFFLLGALKLGTLIGFFPRHILVGCIGGVGVFLIQTGFTVSMRISEDDLGWDLQTLKTVFGDVHNVTLWVVPLALAVLLRVVTARWHHQLIFPLYFLVIPVIFYVVVTAARLDLWELRKSGWLFELGNAAAFPWYKFYSYLDVHAIKFGPLFATLPTQFALLFFNILHPPLNVPALSVSLDEDIDTNKELMAHGYSNFLAGIFGTVPNYLVYVNTLLFYRVGGNTRIAGFVLILATIVLLVIGAGPIAYIPVMVVGALIFVLGIDLVKEALWDTRHRADRMEYITIVSIMVCMTAWDFVVGVLFGIIMSCFFFVLQNSQRRSIRALHSGETAMSAVRRPSLQRAYLREVSKQTMILRLQGFIFFGTISQVEDTIRHLIQGPSWQTNPVRFLVLDLALVAGVDMSAAEAFVRIQRFLAAKAVTLVFSGLNMGSSVAKALESVEVLEADNVEIFSTFHDAMEWTENAYLRAWFLAQKHESLPTAFTLPGRQNFDMTEHSLNSFSPRRSYMRDVGDRTIANELQRRLTVEHSTEPLNTIVKAFSSYGEIDLEVFQPIEEYLERIHVPEGSVLWRQNDPPNGLYIIEAGILRASYQFAEDNNNTPAIEESMVPGTLAGELSALSSLPRNATVVVERDATLWKLSMADLERLDLERPRLSRAFLTLILKAAKFDYDILLSALASRQ